MLLTHQIRVHDVILIIEVALKTVSYFLQRKYGFTVCRGQKVSLIISYLGCGFAGRNHYGNPLGHPNKTFQQNSLRHVKVN